MELKTLDDYLNEYGNTLISVVELNEVDYLFFSLLSYVHLPRLKEEVSYKDFCEKFIKQQAGKPKYGALIPRLVEILKKHKNDQRYQEIIVKNYVYIVDNETQFGAMVFETKNRAIVSFTGSDGSVIGWYENLRCSYQYPIYSQVKSKEYLLSVINDYDDIVITGHSKGGNLAMTSAMGIDDKLLEKIKGIYNFDGQGFFKPILETSDYKNIENKIINYLPEDSYIGVLLYHGGTTRLVKTNCKGINVHFQFNWAIVDKSIMEGKSPTLKSKQIHKLTTKRLERLDKEEMYLVIENAIDALKVDRTAKLKIGFKDIINILKDNHNSKIVTRSDVREVLKAFLLADKFYK